MPLQNQWRLPLSLLHGQGRCCSYRYQGRSSLSRRSGRRVERVHGGVGGGHEKPRLIDNDALRGDEAHLLRLWLCLGQVVVRAGTCMRRRVHRGQGRHKGDSGRYGGCRQLIGILEPCSSSGALLLLLVSVSKSGHLGVGSISLSAGLLLDYWHGLACHGLMLLLNQSVGLRRGCPLSRRLGT